MIQKVILFVDGTVIGVTDYSFIEYHKFFKVSSRLC